MYTTNHKHESTKKYFIVLAVFFAQEEWSIVHFFKIWLMKMTFILFSSRFGHGINMREEYV